jgi:hypothetical protein
MRIWDEVNNFCSKINNYNTFPHPLYSYRSIYSFWVVTLCLVLKRKRGVIGKKWEDRKKKLSFYVFNKGKKCKLKSCLHYLFGNILKCEYNSIILYLKAKMHILLNINKFPLVPIKWMSINAWKLFKNNYTNYLLRLFSLTNYFYKKI